MNWRFRVIIALTLLCAGTACVALLAGAQEQSFSLSATMLANGGGAAVDTSTWKTYRNEKNGFEVKHPETQIVNAGSGAGPDIIEIRGPVGDGKARGSFTLAIQKNQNPKKLPIEEWFSQQLKMMKASPESSGHTTIGGQAAVFMENTNSFGKLHDTFTLLHETDVLSLSYDRHAELDAIYAAIMASFRVGS